MRIPQLKQQSGYLLPLLLALSLTIVLVVYTLNSPVHVDENVFLHLTEGLPSYSSSAEWIAQGNPETYIKESSTFWDKGYSIPVWRHPPLSIILSWPLTKLGLGAHALKYVADVMFLAALVLIFLIIRRRLPLMKATLCFAPLLLLYLPLQGVPFVYHDMFLVPLFALSLYLVDRRSPWAYVAATAMVLTKIDALVLLIPLALYYKNWKMLLPGLSLGAFWAYIWAATGSTSYLFTQWWLVGGLTTTIWKAHILPYIYNLTLVQGYWLILPIIGYALHKAHPSWLIALTVASLGMALYAFAPNHMVVLLTVLPLMMAVILEERKAATA